MQKSRTELSREEDNTGHQGEYLHNTGSACLFATFLLLRRGVQTARGKQGGTRQCLYVDLYAAENWRTQPLILQNKDTTERDR